VKRIGANFQSFSIFTTGSAQTNWNVKVDQYFLARRVRLVAGLRSNEFTNPFIGNNYKSSAIFKSLQLTVRVKKLPVLSLGYYPSSQLTRLSGGLLNELQFYTLNGSLNYVYSIRKLRFNSSILYTRFYNKASDSGLQYFDSRYILLTQHLIAGPLQSSLSFSSLQASTYALYTLSGNADYHFNNWFSCGAGIKYNRAKEQAVNRVGFCGNVAFDIPKVGQLRCYTDNGFIPTINNQLLPNNTGGISYYKTF